MRLLVRAIHDEAPGIRSFELSDPDGHELPPFTAGSHVDVVVPGGPLRQYSLFNDPAERHRYRIAVLLEPSGRGGSRAMHEAVAPGDLLEVSAPRNHFPLEESAERHLLIAGGIGVTPLLAMVSRLQRIGAPFEIHYCTRSAERTAFRDALAPLAAAGAVRFHHDGGDPGRGLDVRALVARADDDEGTHLYCCGPPGLMRAVRDAASAWPAYRLHFEHFAAPATPQPAAAAAGPDAEQAFEVELASSGRVLTVPPGQSILSVLCAAGLSPDSSCEAGVCGVCRTRYLAGDVDHRDFVLADAERADHVMICVSRSRGPRLVLDL